MKYNDIQKKSPKELKELLTSTRAEVQKLQFSVANEQDKNVRKLRNLKKRVARILTALNLPAEQESVQSSK